MPAPAAASPTSPGGAQVASDTETGAESGLDKGAATGGETETEGTGTLGKSGKPKKTKSFKNPFGGKKK